MVNLFSVKIVTDYNGGKIKTMRKKTQKQSSKSTNKKNVKFKLNRNDSCVMKVKWNSPHDKKLNTLDINMNPKKFNTINIEDNH